MLWFGWGGRIRTFDLLIQSQETVRPANPQRSSTTIAVGVAVMVASQVTRHKCGQVTIARVT